MAFEARPSPLVTVAVVYEPHWRLPGKKTCRSKSSVLEFNQNTGDGKRPPRT